LRNIYLDPMPTILSASEQIEELQQQIEQLKHRSFLELKVQLAEARGVVVELESQISKLTECTRKNYRKKIRTSITIADVVRAIKVEPPITKTLRKCSVAPPLL